MTRYIRQRWRRLQPLAWGILGGLAVLAATYLAHTAAGSGPDADNDGMSDEYELFFGLDPNNAADAAYDNDGDGLHNLQESALGTDPFAADTDRDGWNENVDSNPLSRVYIKWGDPAFTAGDDYRYVGPAWWKAAYKQDGEWITNTPTAWHVPASASNGAGSLQIEVDRTILTNDLVMKMDFFDHTDGSLYVDLLATNSIVATNLFGNLMHGSNAAVQVALDIPLESYPAAAGISIYRGSGEITVYTNRLYVDKDFDGLDADQERQLGTSDNNPDSDGDGLTDYAEAFIHGTSPLSTDTDGDGLSDGAEVNTLSTDPTRADTDGDGMRDGMELFFGMEPAVSNTYSTLPFLEFFETNTVALGPIDGKNNWTAAPTNAGIVQAGIRYEGAAALAVTGGGVSTAIVQHLFAAPPAPVVWLDMYVRGVSGAAPTGAVDSAADLYFDSQGRLVVYDGFQTPGNRWITLTNHTPVAVGQWTRLTLKLNYQAGEWIACLDSVPLAQGLGFGVNEAEFAGFALVGPQGYLDRFQVSTNMPEGILLDGDTLPDTWELQYFGNLGQTETDDPDHDGLNNIQEYQLGTNPTNTDTDSDGSDDFTEWQWGGNPTNADNHPTLPWTTDFEASQGYSPGALADQQGWKVLGGTVTVQTSVVFTNGQAVSLAAPNGALASAGILFATVTNPVVWYDCFVKLPRTAPFAGVPQRSTSVFAVNQSGYWSALDGAAWVIASNTSPAATDQWAHVTVREDYGTKNWDLYVGAKPVLKNLLFADTNAARFARFAFVNGSTSCAYLDALHVGTSLPGHIDIDGDGLNNAAEAAAGSDPYRIDTDGDGMDDWTEVKWGHNPAVSNIYGRLDTGSTTNTWETGFEPAEGYAAGGLNGQACWAASNGVAVTAAQSHEGVQSVVLPAQGSTNDPRQDMQVDLGALGRTQVWLTVYARLRQGGIGPEDGGTPAAADIHLCQNRLHAYDGLLGAWAVSERTFAVSTDEWTRLDMSLDYATRQYLVCINGVLALDGVGFGNAEMPVVSRLRIMGSPATSAADSYVDDIRVSTAEPAGLDFDGDGLSNFEEYALGTDPKSADTDGDGITDYDEVRVYNTNPLNMDTDNDGMPDDWELVNSLDPNSGTDAARDTDLDGLTNLEEYRNGTSITNADTDGDGLSDGMEVNTWGSNPLLGDTDGDGLGDKWEAEHGTNPSVDDAAADPDGDGLSNLREYQAGTDPLNPDTDADGVDDRHEIVALTDPLVADFDGTVTTVDVALGHDTVARLGTWLSVDGDLFDADVRGYVEYSLNAPTANVYRIEVDGTQHRDYPTNEVFQFALKAYCDGEYLGRDTIRASHGTYGKASFFTPWLTNGTHRIRLFWENGDYSTALQIKQVALQALGGPDNDGNGVRDWLQTRWSRMYSLDVVPSNTFVSPVCVEGRGWFLSGMNISGAQVRQGAGHRWFADVPLSSAVPTEVTVNFEQGVLAATGTVSWVPLNLLAAADVTIRMGDTLLLTAAPDGITNGAVEIVVSGVTNYSTAVYTPVAHQFVTNGDFIVTGIYSGDFQTNGTITVHVVAAAFGQTPACMVGFEREWPCPMLPDQVVVDPDPALSVSSGSLQGGGRMIYLTTGWDEPLYLVGRLGTNGPIMAVARTDGMQGSNQRPWTMVEEYEDGTQVIEAGLVLTLVPADIEVRLGIFAPGVTFEDGTTSRTMHAEDFNAIGECRYRLIWGSHLSSSTCHFMSIYQGTTHIGGD